MGRRFAIWTPRRWYSTDSATSARLLAQRLGGCVIGPGFEQHG